MVYVVFIININYKMVERMRKQKMPIIISMVILMFWGIGMFFILKDEIKKSHMIQIETSSETFYTNKIDSVLNGIKLIDDHGRQIDIYGVYTIVYPK